MSRRALEKQKMVFLIIGKIEATNTGEQIKATGITVWTSSILYSIVVSLNSIVAEFSKKFIF